LIDLRAALLQADGVPHEQADADHQPHGQNEIRVCDMFEHVQAALRYSSLREEG